MSKRGTDTPYKATKVLNPYKIECGERLRLARLALGFDEVEPFAQALDEKRMNIYTWETGTSLVPVWFVRRFREKFSVGFNWIYDGDMSDMPKTVYMEVLARQNRQRLMS